MPDDLLTAVDVAALTGKHRRTVLRHGLALGLGRKRGGVTFYSAADAELIRLYSPRIGCPLFVPGNQLGKRRVLRSTAK